MPKTYQLRQTQYDAAMRGADVAAFGFAYAGDDVTWWAVRDGGEIKAFCGLDMLHREDAAILCRAWISPSLRGSGLHRRMVRARERCAASGDVERLVSYTARHNCKSANTLIRCGYRTYEPEHEWGLEGCTYWFKII